MKYSASLTAALLVYSTRLFADEPTFEAWLYTGTDVYPSAIIATAAVDWHTDEEEDPQPKGKKKKKKDPDVSPMFGDKNGWVGVRVFDVPKGAKIRVEVAGEGWLKPSKVQVTVEDDESDIIVIPKGVFDFDALRNVTQQKPANLNIKCTINGKELEEQNLVVNIRSVNECPYAVLFEGDDEDTADDLSWLFAAYVNENHPWIDGILKEALEAKLVDSFDGYQSGDPDSVLAQVYAIWHILQRHGIKYSDITNTPKSKFAQAQVVRFLDDSIGASQANCVDGSVIFASILTKISINCGLVLVPGHCFVCFDLDPEGELDVSVPNAKRTVIGLETTMLGANNLKPLAELKKLPGKIQSKVARKEGEDSATTFGNALEVATQVFAEHRKEFDKPGADYHIIPIADARDFGIMPIASGKKRE